jgi:hypothetical protein
VTDSAATSLESALATRTFDGDECNDTTTERQLGVVVNPVTALIDASSNTRALSRFIVVYPRRGKKNLWCGVRGC